LLIHQIWIGNPPPKFVVDAMNTVKYYNKSHTYKLHTNNDLKKYNLDNLLHKVPAAFIADVLRCNILSEYGGCYIDADTIASCDIMDILPEINDSFCTSELDSGPYSYANSLIYVKNKGYNFNNFIKEYIMNEPCIRIWNNFCKKNNATLLSNKKFGTKSNIYKDLRMSSWNTHK